MRCFRELVELVRLLFKPHAFGDVVEAHDAAGDLALLIPDDRSALADHLGRSVLALDVAVDAV